MTLDDPHRVFEELQEQAGLDPKYSFREGYAAVQNGVAALITKDGGAIFCSGWRDFRSEQLQKLVPWMGEHRVILLPERYSGTSRLTHEEVVHEAICVVRRGGVAFIDWHWFDMDGMRVVGRDEAESVIYGPRID